MTPSALPGIASVGPPGATGPTGPSGSTLIQEIIVGAGGLASLDFQSIAGTYRMLQLFFMLRTEGASGSRTGRIRFNNDSGANYYNDTVYATDGTAGGATNGGQAAGDFAEVNDANASQPTQGEIIIPYYAETNYRKGALCRWMRHNGTNFRTGQSAVLWTNTAAITRVTLYTDSADIEQNSRIALYGIT